MSSTRRWLAQFVLARKVRKVPCRGLKKDVATYPVYCSHRDQQIKPRENKTETANLTREVFLWSVKRKSWPLPLLHIKRAPQATDRISSLPALGRKLPAFFTSRPTFFHTISPSPLNKPVRGKWGDSSMVAVSCGYFVKRCADGQVNPPSAFLNMLKHWDLLHKVLLICWCSHWKLHRTLSSKMFKPSSNEVLWWFSREEISLQQEVQP